MPDKLTTLRKPDDEQRAADGRAGRWAHYPVSLNHLNVLTRRRKGLIIVSNRGFQQIADVAWKTAYYRSQYSSCDWTDWRFVPTASVNLPSVVAPNEASLRHSPHPIPISISVNLQPNPYQLATSDISDTNAIGA